MVLVAVVGAVEVAAEVAVVEGVSVVVVIDDVEVGGCVGGRSVAAFARRADFSVALRPPHGNPRSRQSCVMVALLAWFKSVANSRSSGVDMVIKVRCGADSTQN